LLSKGLHVLSCVLREKGSTLHSGPAQPIKRCSNFCYISASRVYLWASIFSPLSSYFNHPPNRKWHCVKSHVFFLIRSMNLSLIRLSRLSSGDNLCVTAPILAQPYIHGSLQLRISVNVYPFWMKYTAPDQETVP
jgi:hypothetical protein